MELGLRLSRGLNGRTIWIATRIATTESVSLCTRMKS